MCSRKVNTIKSSDSIKNVIVTNYYLVMIFVVIENNFSGSVLLHL